MEQAYTHNLIKMAIAAALTLLVQNSNPATYSEIECGSAIRAPICRASRT